MTTKTGDALDFLVNEDIELRQLFPEIENARGSSVEDRALYGDVAKRTHSPRCDPGSIALRDLSNGRRHARVAARGRTARG